MTNKSIDKYLYSTIGFILLGLGISLQIKANIGQSMFNAFSLTLANMAGLNIGTTINCLNLLFFIAYVFVRKVPLKSNDIVQVVGTIMNGYIVNFFVYKVFIGLDLNSYILSLVVFLIGLAFSSISLGLILSIGIIKFPLESLCLAICNRFNLNLSKVRMKFDIFFAIITVLLSLTTKSQLFIREGTVVSFFLLSKLIGTSYDMFKRKFEKDKLILKENTFQA